MLLILSCLSTIHASFSIAVANSSHELQLRPPGVVLAKRDFPDPSPCTLTELWVGRFCDVRPGRRRVYEDVCWQYPPPADPSLLREDPAMWRGDWLWARLLGGLDLSSYDQDLFEPGVLNPARIPIRHGVQRIRRTKCSYGHRCMAMIDGDNDPHVGCLKLDAAGNDDRGRTVKVDDYMQGHEGRYKQLTDRQAEMRDGRAVQDDRAPPSPGPTYPGAGAPVRGRPLVTTWKVDADIDAASLAAMVLDDTQTPVDLVDPMVVELTMASAGRSGDAAKPERVCTGTSAHPAECESHANHDYHKNDVIKVHFVVPLLDWVGDAIDRLEVVGAVAHIGKHV